MGERGRMLDEAAAGDAVALTRALVAEPSVNPELSPAGAGEGEVSRMCATWLEGWGFDTRRLEVAQGRFNVVGRLGDRGGPTLILNGHLDTVGVEGMTVDPFDPVVENGRIFGRGSCDMKSGVAALLAAGAAVAKSGGPDAGTILVVLTADEEHASVGMQSLVAAGLSADAAVVCEPTGLAVMPAHKGFVWLDLLFRGRAAHGSRPEIGVDAIRHAGLYLSALEAVHAGLGDQEPHPLLGLPSFHAGTIEGGSAASVYPAECRLVIERRTLPSEEMDTAVEAFEEVLDRVRRGVPGFDARLVRGLERPGSEIGVDEPVVRGLLAALGRAGMDARVEGMTAWVEASYLNRAGIPAVCFGPGSIAQAHSDDEWVAVEEVRSCAWVLEVLVRRFLTGGGADR